MRLGVVPWPWGGGGGIYQYSHSLMLGLEDLGLSPDCLIYTDYLEEATRVYGHLDVAIRPIEPPPKSKAASTMGRIVGEGPHRDLWRRTMARRSRARRPGHLQSKVVNWKPHLTSMLQEAKVDLMIYAWPSAMCFEARVPYVMAVHDLQHRLQPHFPEVSANGEWETREYILRNGVRYATRIVTDSEVGKQDVLDYYGSVGISEDRVEVLPFVPSPLLRRPTEEEMQATRQRHKLPQDYLFYPAQFWPHKNHVNIIEALYRLKLRGTAVPIVFVGEHGHPMMEETWSRVQQLVRAYELGSQVHFLGYVSDDEMSALYEDARALVMPTFFGPTNIPVVEAWMFDCPVITSDIRGIREHTGEAGYLVDPRSVDEIADGIERVTGDLGLRDRLVKAGRERIAHYGQAEFNQRLESILEKVEPQVATEGFPE